MIASRSERPPAGNQSALWLVSLAILVLITFAPAVFGGASLFDLDLRHVETPIKWLLFKESRGVLWTERMACGFPIHAYGEGGLLYPLNWLLYPLLPMPLAHDCNLALHLMIACLGVFFLAQRVYKHAAASAVSAVVFAFSGFMWVHMGHANSIQACAWAPWAFLALGANRENLRLLPTFWLSLCIAMMLLTRVQYGLYTVVAMGLYAVAQGLKPQAARQIIALVGATLFAFLLAAAQVFPSVELLMHSDRSTGVEYGAQLLGVVSWSQLPWLIAPLWQEGHTQGVTAESIGYVGLTTAVLMVVSLLRLRASRSFPWLFLLILSLLLSMGDAFPLNVYIYRMPGFSFFRCHARWLFVAALAAAMLAGFGADNLLQRAGGRLRANLLGLLMALVIFFDLSYFLRPAVHFLDRTAQEAVPEVVSRVPKGKRYFVHDTPPVFVEEKEALKHSSTDLQRRFAAAEPLNANLGARHGLSSVQVYSGLLPRWSSQAFSRTALEELSEMGCQYLVSRHAVEVRGWREAWRNPFLGVYINEHPEPRIRIVSGIRPDKDKGNAAWGKIAGSAEIIPAPSEEEIRISVHSGGAGFLVLADTYFPGWSAYVNGREETIYRVEGWMRGVAIPAGDSEVHFRYRPPSFLWGTVTSGAALLALVSFSLWGGRRGSRSPQSHSVKPSSSPMPAKDPCQKESEQS